MDDTTFTRLVDGPWKDLVNVDAAIVLERMITTPGVKQLARKIVLTITRLTVKGSQLCRFNVNEEDESVIYHVSSECRMRNGKVLTQATFAAGLMEQVVELAALKMRCLVQMDGHSTIPVVAAQTAAV
jgi:enhancing lycopene biosynthesis protein 2